jgi:hypothetical protein
LLNIEKSHQIKFNKIQRKTKQIEGALLESLWCVGLPKFLTYGVKNIEFWEIFVIEIVYKN